MTILLVLVLLNISVFAAKKATAAHGPSARVDYALKLASKTYGVPYGQARAVSYCESRWYPGAVGNGSYGLFQFLRGTWANTPSRNCAKACIRTRDKA